MKNSTLKIDTQSTRAALRRRKGNNFYTFMSKGFSLSLVFLMIIINTNMSCKTPKTGNSIATSTDGTLATVVDYTGLDGCRKMLMLDDGRLMLPMNYDNSVQGLHYGQRVSITFEIVDAMVSICMAENISATIKTIDLTENVDLSWLDGLTKKSNPYSINRCNDADGEFIYVQTGKLASAYTLDGKEMCSTPGKAMSECVRRFDVSDKCRIKGMP